MTKNPVNQLNPFNDAIFIALIVFIMVYAKWQTRRWQARKRNRTGK